MGTGGGRGKGGAGAGADSAAAAPSRDAPRGGRCHLHITRRRSPCGAHSGPFLAGGEVLSSRAPFAFLPLPLLPPLPRPLGASRAFAGFNETGSDDQEDVSQRGRAEHPRQELLPHGHPGLLQGGQDGHRLTLPHRPLRGAVHPHHRGLPPQVLQHPRRGLPARHPGHVGQPPLPSHAPPLHPHRRCVHPGVQPGQPGLLRGGAAPEAADPGDQVVPEEQNQGEHRGAPGHLRQQGRPGLLPGGAAPGDRAAGGGRPQEMRLLRDLGQEEQQPGPDVPGALRHGQAAQRDEPRPAPQGLGPVLRHPAQEGAERQKAAERGRPGRRGGGVRHRGSLRPPAQRPQRPHVHPGESHRRWARQGEGPLRDQLGAPEDVKEGRKEGRKAGRGKEARFRSDFGQAGGWAGAYPGRGTCFFPSLPPPVGRFSSAPTPGAHFGRGGCGGGGFGGQEGGARSSLLQGERRRKGGWVAREDEPGGRRPRVSFPPKTPSLGPGHRSQEGGQRPVRIHLGLGVCFCFVSFCFYLRSCARTLALCRVFVCVCKTRAEDTPKLLQRRCRVTAPMDQKLTLVYICLV